MSISYSASPVVTPVTILTGFLGSGKTTFLNWLLTQPNMENVVVIVNEFGEIGLDHLLIATPSENIVLLEGGCLCCEVRGDLVETLTDLWEKRDAGLLAHFDKVVVETTGLSNPIPIVQTVLCDESLREKFLLSKVITLVDTVNGPAQVAKYLDAVRQIAVADVLLTSKTDLHTDHNAAEAFLETLRQLNPWITPIPVDHGVPRGLTPQTLLDRDQVRERDEILNSLPNDSGFGHAGVMTGQLFQNSRLKTIEPSLQSLGIESFSLRRTGEISANNMVVWLNLLATMKGENLLRLKAILNVEGSPVVIHAAQTIVHEPIQLSDWPSLDRDSRFVVISNGSMRHEFEESLEALRSEIVSRDAGMSMIDPVAYKNFLKIAEAFSAKGHN
jgi:G3E family GTPase